MPFTNSIYRFDYKGFDMTLEKVRLQDGATEVETTLATISRNVLNQITQIDYPASSVTYTRDTQGRITFSLGPGFNKMYTQTSQGCTGWVDAEGSHTVTLDAGGRVTGVSHPVGSVCPEEIYAYDTNNNRTWSKHRRAAVYSSDFLAEDGSYNYTYDLNGRLIAQTPKSAPNVLRTFSYDAEGNLVEVKTYNGADVASGLAKSVTYDYNALGLRVNRKVNDSSTTYYLYDTAKRLVGMQIGITPEFEFSHADDASRPLTMLRGGVLYTYYQDAFRNIISVSDSTGVVATYRYDAYGRLVDSTGASDNPFRYAGAEYDTETGLYYMKHRWYDPEIGRFITPDPYLFSAGYNLFNYAKGNPYRYFDPEGRDEEDYHEEWDGQIEFNDPYDYVPETTPAENSQDTTRPSSEEYDPTGYGQTRMDKADNVNTQEHINDSVVDGALLGGEQVLQEGAKQGVKYGLATSAGKWLATAAPRVMGLGARAVPFVNVALWTKDILDVGAYAYGQYEYYRCAP
jgi:RHS repeat-associated protein